MEHDIKKTDIQRPLVNSLQDSHIFCQCCTTHTLMVFEPNPIQESPRIPQLALFKVEKISHLILALGRYTNSVPRH